MRRSTLQVAAGPLLLATAATLWIVSLSRTDLSTMSGYGLIASADWTYPLAAVLTLLGAVVELTRSRWRAPVLAASVVLLILIVHATVPLLSSEPEYAWTYKHVGVIELLGHSGAVVDRNDIYQQWPGFFATIAQLSAATGVAPLRLAQWEPVLANLVYCLLLLGLFRTHSRDRRLSVLAVLIYECANWTGQYLCPQDYSYILSLGILLAAIRWLRRIDPPADDRPGPVVVRMFRRWRARLAAPPVLTGRARWIVLIGVYAVFSVITAAHQLSPYIVVIDLAALGLAGFVRPWHLAVGLGCIAIAYLIPRESYVAATYGIFDGTGIVANASGNAQGWGTPEQGFSALVVRSLALSMWGGALLGVVLAWRRAGQLAIPAILTFAPFTLLFAASYGGEAIYRVYLFSAPWAAFIIGRTLLRIRWPLVATIAAGTTGLVVMLGAGVQGLHGQLLVDRTTPPEVSASRYFYRHAPHGSILVLAANSFPTRVSGDYRYFNRWGDPELITGAQLAHRRLGAEDLTTVEQFVRAQGGVVTYLAISRGMADYAHYFGYLPDGALARLDRTLRASSRWRVFYRNADTVIYQLLPQRSTVAPR